jgi:hypothetical protein
VRDEALRCFRVCGAVFFFRLVHLDSTSDPTLTNDKRWGRAQRTTVLSETRHGAGLTLLRVLRGGLELDETSAGVARSEPRFYLRLGTEPA